MMALSVMFQSLFYFVLLCSTLFYFVLLCSTLFYFILLCSTSVVLQLTGCSWIHGGFVTLDFELLLQNLFLLAVNCSQFVQTARLLLCMYVLYYYIIHTYIHTYPLQGGYVCMYVCMYYILYKCIYYIIHRIQFSELLQCSV